MWYRNFFLSVTFIGLAAALTALILLSRESGNSWGWLRSRQGLGMLCVLAAGAGLAVGAQLKLVIWYPVMRSYPHGFLVKPGSLGFLSPRTTALLVACLVLLAIGGAVRVLGAPSGAPSARYGHGPFVAAVAVALIFVLAELSVFQNQRYEQAGFIERIPTRRLVAIENKANRDPIPHFHVYQNRYNFSPRTVCFFEHNVPIWNKALERYKAKPEVNYLEIGLFEGQSFLWMLENVLTNPTARATGIDPFSDPSCAFKSRTYKEIFYSNLTASGSENKTRIIEGYSQTELRKLPLESFDIIYIDGSHISADVLEDAILSWRLLKDGGVLIFDDYSLHTGMDRAIDTFYDFFSERFKPLHVDWQVLLRKESGARADAPRRNRARPDPGLGP
jgi:hypothetical protein